MKNLKDFFERIVNAPTTFALESTDRVASYSETEHENKGTEENPIDFTIEINIKSGNSFRASGSSQNKEDVRERLLLYIVLAGLTYRPIISMP